MKNASTVGVVGSLVINLMLALAIAAVFSVSPTAQAEEAHCTAAPAAQPAPQASLVRAQDDYVVAARMGWSAG